MAKEGTNLKKITWQTRKEPHSKFYIHFRLVFQRMKALLWYRNLKTFGESWIICLYLKKNFLWTWKEVLYFKKFSKTRSGWAGPNSSLSWVENGIKLIDKVEVKDKVLVEVKLDINY